MGMPCLRDFLPLNVKVVVVGVAGGEEGPACEAKLKLGVVGRIFATSIFRYMYVCANWHELLEAEGLRRQRPR